jgi:hypothetical protein
MVVNGTPTDATLLSDSAPVDARSLSHTIARNSANRSSAARAGSTSAPAGRPAGMSQSERVCGAAESDQPLDLTTLTPIGDPLTGHTGPVDAVAALVLPDGRPVAITGSSDATSESGT